MKFPAVCRYCRLRIDWNETHRTWDRISPNKYYEDPREQRTKCAQSVSGWHDPNPRRA